MRKAVALCHAGATETQSAAQLASLDPGFALAEEALRSDDRDVAAHFAVFCNLGRRLRLRRLGLGSLAAVRRVRDAINRALELASDSAELLTAKGMIKDLKK